MASLFLKTQRLFAVSCILLTLALQTSAFSFEISALSTECSLLKSNLRSHVGKYHQNNVRIPSRSRFLMKTAQPDPNLSPEDKERGKRLADAWIRQDKSNDCNIALKVRSFWHMLPCGKQTFLQFFTCSQ
jgi:hypothetical protein